MIRSMTGFGDAECDTPLGRLRLEVKTVNHRFFNASVKTPPGMDRFEPALTAVLKEHVKRGHVSAFLSLDRGSSAGDAGPRVDLEKARSYHEALQAVKEHLDLPGSVDLALLARFTDIFREPPSAGPEELDPERIRDLAAAAAAAVVAMREAEGRRLRTDMEDGLRAIEEALAEVEELAPRRLTAERDRLREAVRELTEQVEVDEDRLAREIAYLAERWDINEEIVRFRAHAHAFRDAMAADGSEPVGKRLGFLVQEMHREANTIGSKANDACIARLSVAMKEVIERLREQVENVE